MKQFSSIAKFLHWSVASLIVSQYVLAKLAENAKHNDQILEQLALLANHKSIGITILSLAIIRLIYRSVTPAPSHPPETPKWQINASKVSHYLLYGFLFALPISGWLMSSAKAYSVSWFNVLVLPDFVAPNELLAEQLHALHHYLGEALFVVAVIHILAALKHHFIDRDDVLARMSSTFSLALFAVLIVSVIGILGRIVDFSPNSKPAQAKAQSVLESAALQGEKSNSSLSQKSNLPLWNIDYEKSYIKFKGDQAGAPFEGEWQRWSADIRFEESQLDSARFNVAIDLNSGFSNDQDRDDTIRSADFFNVALFPEASYLANAFSNVDGLYQTIGTLSMKSISADATLIFSVTDDGKSRVLSGTALLDRFAWNIGSGDWADTTWVGQSVMVEVRVVTND